MNIRDRKNDKTEQKDNFDYEKQLEDSRREGILLKVCYFHNMIIAKNNFIVNTITMYFINITYFLTSY